jgi:hypothetical protein
LPAANRRHGCIFFFRLLGLILAWCLVWHRDLMRFGSFAELDSLCPCPMTLHSLVRSFI